MCNYFPLTPLFWFQHCLRPGLNVIFDNVISPSRFTERRGITLWGEHPLCWRPAVCVLPDRRGGKINRCVIPLLYWDLLLPLYSISPAVWMINRQSVTAFVYICVFVCVFPTKTVLLSFPMHTWNDSYWKIFFKEPYWFYLFIFPCRICCVDNSCWASII